MLCMHKGGLGKVPSSPSAHSSRVLDPQQALCFSSLSSQEPRAVYGPILQMKA